MSLPSRDLDALREESDRLADQLPSSATKDEALAIAIQAAETSLKALRLVSDPNEKARYTIRVKQLMREAEDIKKNANWKPTQSTASAPIRKAALPDPNKVRVLTEPVNSRELSTREKIIKIRASHLNGSVFPEWNGSPSPDEFEIKEGDGPFFDELSELSLSDFQHDVLDDWKRPIDALPPPAWFPGDQINLGPVMNFYRDIDLVQDAATDCSVVASLCAGIARGQRGHPKMMHAVLHPYDFKNGQPLMSPNGKYIVRLNFNGCYRKVVIDDRIPTSSTSRVIHVVDRKNPGLLWPALIEKSYLKIRGGYDFPGSNSATDLWILTGWIPEQVFLQDDLDLDACWRRIMSAFMYGDVLITMGTGKMSSNTERALGLAGEHDYAVLDLREVGGQRLFLIKNPWVQGTSWSGRFSAQPKTEASSKGPQEENLVQIEDELESVQSPRDLLNSDGQLTPGSFWMDFDNVAQHFDNIYLNWNTGLFKYRQDFHFKWDLSESTEAGAPKQVRGAHASLQHRPQFTVTASGSESIWILLCRHFRNTVPENATSDEIESGRYFIDERGYMALAVSSANGHRVVLPENFLQKGWFNDSPQTLLKIETCERGKIYTIVPLEQALPSTEHTFTISAFSRSPITLAEALCKFAHVDQVSGTWTKETAGGNAQHPTYCDNPQFAITVPQKTTISVLLEADLNVHVRLLHSKGQRIFRIRNRDIIVDSKEYRPGCCLAQIEDLDPGQYTILCSTFEPQQLGDFSLRIESTHPTRTLRLPREGAGRIRMDLSTVAFKQGQTKMAAPLVSRRLINFYAIARHFDQQNALNKSTSGRSSYSHARLSVELGRGPQRRILIASENGEYSDSACAVRTDPIDLSADFRKYGYGDCWLVLDRMYVSSESQDERFGVELFVDQPNAVEVGVWRAWED